MGILARVRPTLTRARDAAGTPGPPRRFAAWKTAAPALVLTATAAACLIRAANHSSVGPHGWSDRLRRIGAAAARTACAAVYRSRVSRGSKARSAQACRRHRGPSGERPGAVTFRVTVRSGQASSTRAGEAGPRATLSGVITPRVHRVRRRADRPRRGFAADTRISGWPNRWFAVVRITSRRGRIVRHAPEGLMFRAAKREPRASLPCPRRRWLPTSSRRSKSLRPRRAGRRA